MYALSMLLWDGNAPFFHTAIYFRSFSFSPLCLTTTKWISIQRNGSFITKNRFFCAAQFCSAHYLYFSDTQHLFILFSGHGCSFVRVLIVCPIRKLFCQSERERDKDCVFGKNMNAHLSWCLFLFTWRFVVGHLCVHQYSCLKVYVLVSIPFPLAHTRCDKKSDQLLYGIWTFAITMCRTEEKTEETKKKAKARANKQNEPNYAQVWWFYFGEVPKITSLLVIRTDRSASRFVAFYSLFLLFWHMFAQYLYLVGCDPSPSSSSTLFLFHDYRLTNTTFSTWARLSYETWIFMFFSDLFYDMVCVYVCAKFIHISLSINLHTLRHTLRDSAYRDYWLFHWR